MGLIEIAGLIGALSTLLVALQGLVSVIQGLRRSPAEPACPPAPNAPMGTPPVEGKPLKKKSLHERLSFIERGEFRRANNGKGKS